MTYDNDWPFKYDSSESSGPFTVMSKLLWQSICKKQNRLRRRISFLQAKNKPSIQIPLKDTLTIFSNQKLWVTYTGIKTVQPKCLQCSYVKIMFSVATKMLTRMWMSLTSQLWELQASVVPGSPLSDCPCATGSGVAAPQSGAWQPCEPSESRACRHPAPGTGHDSPTQKALHEFLKTLSLRSTWLGILA